MVNRAKSGAVILFTALCGCAVGLLLVDADSATAIPRAGPALAERSVLGQRAGASVGAVRGPEGSPPAAAGRLRGKAASEIKPELSLEGVAQNRQAGEAEAEAPERRGRAGSREARRPDLGPVGRFAPGAPVRAGGSVRAGKRARAGAAGFGPAASGAATDRSAASAPASAVAMSELDADDASAKTEEDEEQDEGVEVPELGPTKTTLLTGKLMSEWTRKGVPGGVLSILVFHPLSQVPGAPLWVVPVPAQTDGNGNFAVSIELPEKPPLDAPQLGLSFRGGGKEAPLMGVPISKLVPGEEGRLGVFWLRRRQVVLVASVDPTLLEPAKLIDTGALNPLRWDPRQRINLLGSFDSIGPVLPEGYRGPMKGPYAIHGSQRWLTLVGTEGPMATRKVDWKWLPYTGADGIERKRQEGHLAIRLGLGRSLSLTGSVITQSGQPLAKSVITTVGGQGPARTVVTGEQGLWKIDALPVGMTGFKVSHPEYLDTSFEFDAAEFAPTFILEARRPDFTLIVSDAQSGDPIRKLTAAIKGPMDKKGHFSWRRDSLSSAEGRYHFTAPWPIRELYIEADGFFSKSFTKLEQRPESPVALSLEPARTIIFTGREAVERSERWSDHPETALTTNWSGTWLEFEVDHGDEPTAFNIELGLRNNGIVDHEYRFSIRINLEGDQARHLAVLANDKVTQTARTSLIPRTGRQRVRITWLNDRWIPKQLDANVVVDWIKFQQRPLTASERKAIQDSAQ